MGGADPDSQGRNQRAGWGTAGHRHRRNQRPGGCAQHGPITSPSPGSAAHHHSRSGGTGATQPAWAEALEAGTLFVSVVTLQELELGVLLMERRDPAQGALLRQWLERPVLPAFAGRKTWCC